MDKLESKSLSSIIKTRKMSRQKQQRNIKPGKSKNSNSTESESIVTDFNVSNVNLSELIYPCRDEILYTKILLLPHQMNNDLYINLKKNLVDKVEGKCIKEGFVIKVYKLLEYNNGIVEPENFTGSAVYDVKYLAKICIALKESTIIARVKSYVPNANFALAEFGSIINIIFTKNERDLNTRKFIIGNDKSLLHIPTKKKIGTGDYIKIQLKSVRFYKNDVIIGCMGYLDDLASPEEIAKYGYNNDIISKEIKQIEYDSTIYFNEDNEIEEQNIDKSLVIKSVDDRRFKNNNFNDI